MLGSGWSAWRRPLVIIVASRLLAILLLAIGAARLSMLPGTGLPIHPPLDIWDGPWYLSIATSGYHGLPLVIGPGGGFYDIAFFPAWPLLLRALSLAGQLSLPLIAALSANALFVAGGLATFAWGQRTFGRPAALRALILLCFGPAAYVGSLDYSEPLFLLAAAGWFLAADRPMTRAELAIGAGFTRVTGLAIAAAAAVRLVLARGHDREALLSLVGALGAFAAWWLVAGWIMGDPAGWLRGSLAWFGAGGTSGGLGSFADLAGADLAWRALAGAIVGWLLVAAGGLILLVRERRFEAVGYVGLVLAMAVWFGAWSSWPRFALMAFPAFAILAARISTRYWWLLLGAAFGLELWLATLAGAGLLVP